jgi:uncharacterized membrane protein
LAFILALFTTVVAVYSRDLPWYVPVITGFAFAVIIIALVCRRELLRTPLLLRLWRPLRRASRGNGDLVLWAVASVITVSLFALLYSDLPSPYFLTLVVRTGNR